MTELGEPKPNEGGANKLPKRHWEAARKERFFDLKVSHCVEIILTLALVGIGCLQYTVYARQAVIMQTQVDIMDAELRPWIKTPEIKIEGPFTFGPTGDASVRIKINSRNVGKSVAFNVWPVAYLYVFVEGKPSQQIPTDSVGVCDPKNMPESALDVAGDAVFPDETLPSDRTYAPHIDQSEILAADAAKQNPGGAVLFFVIACVDYRVAKRHYKTGVTFMVGEVGSKSLGIIPANGKSIPAERLYLNRVPSGFAR